MDQDKQHPDSNPDDHSYLFDQLDKIVADANDAEFTALIEDADARLLSAEREAAMIDAIGRILDDDVAVRFDTLYGETIDGRREVGALEVMNAFEEYTDENTLDDGHKEMVDALISLNRVVLDSSFVGVDSAGFYYDGIPKKEVQLAVLTDEALPPWLKRNLIGIVDRQMTGESLDTSDPDAVSLALTKRQKAFDDLTERPFKRQVVNLEFERFAEAQGTPAYAALMSDVHEAVRGHDSADAVIIMFAGDPRLQELGIPDADFADAMRASYRLINGG